MKSLLLDAFLIRYPRDCGADEVRVKCGELEGRSDTPGRKQGGLIATSVIHNLNNYSALIARQIEWVHLADSLPLTFTAHVYHYLLGTYP